MPPASLFLLFLNFSLAHSEASVMSYLKRSVIYLRPPCFCQVDSVRAAGKKKKSFKAYTEGIAPPRVKRTLLDGSSLISFSFLHTHMQLRFSSDMIWFGWPGWPGWSPPPQFKCSSALWSHPHSMTQGVFKRRTSGCWEKNGTKPQH